MSDLSAVVVPVSELSSKLRSLQKEKMKYALLYIADDEGEKRLYFRAFSESKDTGSDFDFGSIASVSELLRD